MLEITVDPGSHVPPYEQLRQQFADLIAGGTLGAGQRLPPRSGNWPATSGSPRARSPAPYKELETAGLVLTRRAAGTVVAPVRPHTTDGRVETVVRQYIQAVKRLGLSATQAAEAVKQNWDAA
ncbi:GntR family transcriptional regulator [Catelliglobosispora koreensis]|uniref:GntR family transcriptional regulator n=1 Tax=Catelliglobosispora koreensis TaxID=129052 RepID=UPI0003A5E7B5